MGTIVVLFMLAVAWTWYLVTWLRGRTEHRNVNSISSFSRHLSVLERTTPTSGDVAPTRRREPAAVPAGAAHLAALGAPAATPVVPMTLSDAQRRRRNVLVALAAVAALTLVAALVVGGTALWALQLVADVLLVGFVALLARSRALAVEQAEKVHYLYEDEDGAWYEGWEDDESAWDEVAGDDQAWADEDGWYAEEEPAAGYLLQSGS